MNGLIGGCIDVWIWMVGWMVRLMDRWLDEIRYQVNVRERWDSREREIEIESGERGDIEAREER